MFTFGNRKTKGLVLIALLLGMAILPFSGCAETVPAPKHDLTITTEPAHGGAVYVDGVDEQCLAGDAPVTVSLDAGWHTIYILIPPGEWGLGTWEDGSTENPRKINLQSDKTVTMRLVHLFDLFEQVEVPINLMGAKNVGSLHVELVHDPAVLEVAYTEAGWMGKEWLGNIARSEVDLETAGRVIIEMSSGGGINGDGSLEVITFDVLGEAWDTWLALENVKARDATTAAEIPTRLSSGYLVLKDRLVHAPAITFYEDRQVEWIGESKAVTRDKYLFVEEWTGEEVRVLRGTKPPKVDAFPLFGYSYYGEVLHIRGEYSPGEGYFPGDVDLGRLKVAYGHWSSEWGDFEECEQNGITWVYELPHGDLKSVDPDGTIHLVISDEEVSLAPGEEWTQQQQRRVETSGLRKVEFTTQKRITNFGLCRISFVP
ncbi:MAG: hypothetical protein ISS54_04715 [Dehalococcoidia bacterium]|nr:hypothetical protein [Dehalococcoidia bacterium]